jgi:hypothetical protein
MASPALPKRKIPPPAGYKTVLGTFPAKGKKENLSCSRYVTEGLASDLVGR